MSDPKQQLLESNGFIWVGGVGVWLNEAQCKIVSGRAMQACVLGQLVAFVHKPRPRCGWLIVSGGGADPVRERVTEA